MLSNWAVTTSSGQPAAGPGISRRVVPRIARGCRSTDYGPPSTMDGSTAATGSGNTTCLLAPSLARRAVPNLTQWLHASSSRHSRLGFSKKSAELLPWQNTRTNVSLVYYEAVPETNPGPTHTSARTLSVNVNSKPNTV